MVIPLVALILSVLILAVSFSVDMGVLASRARDMQAIADAASLDAARVLDGRSAALLQLPVQSVAEASAQRNKFHVPTDGTLKVELGRWDIVGHNFILSDPTDPTDRPNAVRVEAQSTVKFLFQPGGASTKRHSVALRVLTTTDCCGTTGVTPTPLDSTASFSLGSFLLGLDLPPTSAVDGPAKTAVFNALFGNAFGKDPASGIGLRLVDYRGLASAVYSLGDLRGQLGLGSVDQLLNSKIKVYDLVAAAESLSLADHTTWAALDNLKAQLDTSREIKLGDVIDIVGNDQSAENVKVNLLEVLGGNASLMNDEHFLTGSLTVGIPGFAGVVIKDLKVIEPAKTVSGSADRDSSGNWITQAHTAQVHLEVEVDIAGLPALTLTVESATANASLTQIACTAPTDNTAVGFDLTTSAGTVDLSGPLGINGHTGLVTNSFGTITMTGADIGHTQTFGSNNAVNTALFDNLNVAGLPLGPLLSALTPTLNQIGSSIVNPILSAEGALIVAGGDLTLNGFDCGVPRLVN